VYGNENYDYGGMQPGPEDILEDPLFVDKDGGDYHLTVTSPCIDAGWSAAPGIPDFDMDGEGRIYNLMVDTGADECWSSATTISDARSGYDGLAAELTGAIVTAAFDGFFYIEADDGSCGIRVDKAAHGLAVDDRADGVGTLQTNSHFARYMDATSVTDSGTGSDVPLGMTNLTVGGGDWHYNPVSGAGQRGISDAFGLNNIGLLVRTCGAFVYVDAQTFTIDDGSGVHIKCVVPAGVVIDPEWAYVVVTGISSCEKIDDQLHRLIRVRGQGDIVPMWRAARR